jgi:uncharacterized delta-60 repeat protein
VLAAKRWAVVGLALVAGAGAGVALASSGGLDPSFGTAGTVLLDRPTSTFPTPAALVSGGSIVVVTSANGKVVVSRLLPGGAPDPTFDGDGQAIIQSAGHYLWAYGLAVQPDGKIVVAGATSTATGSDAMVWRLMPDGGSGAPNGALDPTFDTDGIAELHSDDDNTARAVAIRPDGKIVVAGTAFTSPGPQRVAVWRLNAGGGPGTTNGALDPGFDTDGVAGISDSSTDIVNSLVLQPDGKIVIAGSTSRGSNPENVAVWRVKADGGTGLINDALDSTFDTDGQADVDSGGTESATAVALQPDGKILVGGHTEGGPYGGAAMVWRLKADGGSGVTNDALDPDFDVDGAAAINGGGYARGEALARQPDGKILLAGSGFTGTNPSAAIVWRLAMDGGAGAVDGALDPTFGAGGSAIVNAPPGAGALALALAPDRRIVAAGVGPGENLLVFRVFGDPFAVTVTRAGTGSGSVQSSPAGIDCGATCSGPFDDGAAVTLTASPAAGSAFAGWSGAGCSGAGTCALTMGADQAVTATFDALGPPPPPRHFVLKAAQLSMKALSRTAKTASATVTGVPASTKISGSVVAGAKTLAKAGATATVRGRARLRFTFSRTARKRLRSAKLKKVTLAVTATPRGDRASKASKRVRLKRAK